MNKCWRGYFIFLCLLSLFVEGCSWPLWLKPGKKEPTLTHAPSVAAAPIDPLGETDLVDVPEPKPEKTPCGLLRSHTNASHQASHQNDSALEQDLLRTAQSIERSLTTLASAQEAKSPPVIRTAPLVTSEGGMGGKIDVDWVGPLLPLLDKIAQLTHYRIKVLGKEPPLPIIISVCQKGAVIADVLQNASFQAGARAKILVFPEGKVIEIRYL